MSGRTLYQAETSWGVCAGFVVDDATLEVVEAAPIMRRFLGHPAAFVRRAWRGVTIRRVGPA